MLHHHHPVSIQVSDRQKLFNKSDPKLHLVGVDSTEITHMVESHFINVGNHKSNLIFY